MNELHQSPSASAIVNSLRAIGYSFNTAVADIVDNSIAAGASAVAISFRTSPVYVAIVDNGQGMTQSEVVAAMRHGGIGPAAARSVEDLGRFGLGLKTASLSQCRRLTVLSLQDGVLSGARWDLDVIEQRDAWILQLLHAEEADAFPGVADLRRFGHGTVVLWENLDRATPSDAPQNDSLQRTILECGDHLALVFHRYIAPGYGVPVRLSINGRAVEAADPFMLRNPYTELAGEETYSIGGATIHIKAYILPHISKMTNNELERSGGKQCLRDTQGFYIYRNRRLITYGTWFKLLGRDELTRLARIQIDIPNTLDDLWNLDVRKSTASPPHSVKILLRQIIQIVAEKSVNVFKEKRRPSGTSNDVIYLWKHSRIRGGVRYDINRSHPLLDAFSAELTHEQARQFGRLLTAIELALPARQIYVDQACDEPIQQASDDLDDTLPVLLQDILKSMPPDERPSLIDHLLSIEPFKNYPTAARSIIEALT